MTRAIQLFLLIFISTQATASPKPFAPEYIQGVPVVSAEQAIDLILNKSDLIIIDSRKESEFQKGHIEGAINLLNTKITQKDLEKVAPDKSSLILFYCNGTRCLRSSDSIYKAKAWGYKNLVWFRGGWKEWTEKRLPAITK